MQNNNNYSIQLKALEQEIQAFEAKQASSNINQQQKTTDLLQFINKKVSVFLASFSQKSDLLALEQHFKAMLNIDPAQADEQNIVMALQEIRKITN
jgi:hypothetical protein